MRSSDRQDNQTGRTRAKPRRERRTCRAGDGDDSPAGVWRSLVARSVRVGEVPSSNLGTPIHTGQRKRSRGRRLRERDARPMRGAHSKGPGFRRPTLRFRTRCGRHIGESPMRLPCSSVRSFLACCGVASGRSGADPRGRRRRPQVDGGHEGRRLQPPGRRLQGCPHHAQLAAGADEARRRTARPTCAAPRRRRSSGIASSSASSATRPRRRVQPEARTQYCSYVVDALSRAKSVNDVVIWNEANSALFWRPQQGARPRLRGAARRVLRHAAQGPAHGRT